MSESDPQKTDQKMSESFTAKHQLNSAHEKTPKTQRFQGSFEEFSYENVIRKTRISRKKIRFLCTTCVL